MNTIRYHNRSAAGHVFTELNIHGAGRFYADLEMGFFTLEDNDVCRAHAKSIGLEMMEHEPTIPVALADPRIIEQHTNTVVELQGRIETLKCELEIALHQVTKLTEERDIALADKTKLLQNYERAITLAEAAVDPKPAKGAKS